MEKITIENIEQGFPSLIDYDLIRKKGLGDVDLNDRYFELLNKYKELFEQYLLLLLPLQKIDSNIKSSGLGFEPIEEENMDYYQMTSTLGLTYLYPRNNFYIEKLSEEDLNELESYSAFDEKSEGFIRRTYKEVINPYDDSKMIFYGPENERYVCDSTDVVIGIRYDEFKDTGLSDDEFQKKFTEQLEFISQVITVLEIVGLEKLDTDLRCIQYNEGSIKKNMDKSRNI